MSLGLQPASIGGMTKTLVVAQDPNGNIAAAHVTVNSSGVEVGVVGNPFAVIVANQPTTQAITAAVLPLPSGAAQDGADASGIATPSGGSGMRGWLSGIYGRLGGTLSVAVANLPATQAITATVLPLPSGAAQDGADATGIASPSGGSGMRGWLSGIYGRLGGTLSVAVANLPATQAITAAVLPLPSGAAQDGADANGVLSPGGGVGIRGWLSGIYARLGNTLSVSVTNLPGTQAISAVGLPLPAGAATAAKQPAPGLAGAPSADVLTVQGNAAGLPLPVSGTIADSNSAPFLGVVPITPGTAVSAQRSIGFICTAGGSVTLTLADTSTLTIPLSVSGGAFQQLPFAVTNVALGSGTSGTFWGLK